MTPLDVPLRILGVEDGSFDAFNRDSSSYTLLCGVLMDRDKVVCIRHKKIKIDGLDATEKLLSLIRGLDLDVVILGGITFGGFNVINPRIIHSEMRVPVIVYSGVQPDNDAVLMALKKHFPDWKIRWKMIKDAGEIYNVQIFDNSPEIYFEVVGCEFKLAEKILKTSAMVNRIPEPVRVAGLIARGLTRVYESL